MAVAKSVNTPMVTAVLTTTTTMAAIAIGLTKVS
jgi:hypothetical protein